MNASSLLRIQPRITLLLIIDSMLLRRKAGGGLLLQNNYRVLLLYTVVCIFTTLLYYRSSRPEIISKQQNKKHGLLLQRVKVYNIQLKVRYSWCVLCVFFPLILDIKFVGRTSRGHTGGRSHRIYHPPSFCGACLTFSREKDSAIHFPRRPCVCVCFLPTHSGLQWTYQPGSHRKKVTQDFPSTFFLRCLPQFFSREGFSHFLPSSTVKSSFVY